jgi:hypothetical protein
LPLTEMLAELVSSSLIGIKAKSVPEFVGNG